MKVTIAIAVYNVELYVEKSVASALNQDFDDYEVLVVDDCGSDCTIEKVEKLMKSSPKGYIVSIIHHEQNKGTGAVRNTCIEKARGEYILFMDGDDYLSPESVKLLYEASKINDADIVMGNHQRVYSDGKIESTSNYKAGMSTAKYAITSWMSNNNTNYYPVATWNKLFKTSFLRTNNIKCVSWHRQEDIFFSLQTLLVAKTIVTIPEITYYWLQRDGSCIHQDATEWHLRQYLDIFDRCISLLEGVDKNDNKAPKELYWIVTQRYLSGFITQNILKSYRLSNKQKNDYLRHIKIITRHISFLEEYNCVQKIVYLALKSPCPLLYMRLLYTSSKIRKYFH